MNKIRKGDEVIVLAGRDKGKRGKVQLRKGYIALQGEGHQIEFRNIELQLLD